MPKPTITDHEILEAALLGLQHSLATVDEKMKELRRRIGGKAARDGVAASAGPAAPKRFVSAAARKRMAAAQKKRWAALRKAQPK